MSDTLHRQVEEVRCTRDAGVVIADRLFQNPGQLVVRQVEMPLENEPEIRLDRQLVLSRRGALPRTLEFLKEEGYSMKAIPSSGLPKEDYTIN